MKLSGFYLAIDRADSDAKQKRSFLGWEHGHYGPALRAQGLYGTRAPPDYEGFVGLSRDLGNSLCFHGAFSLRFVFSWVFR